MTLTTRIKHWLSWRVWARLRGACPHGFYLEDRLYGEPCPTCDYAAALESGKGAISPATKLSPVSDN